MELISLTWYWETNDTNEIQKYRQLPFGKWKRKYWLVIPKEWDKLMIPREEYLGIKWEFIHKEMVFETIELYWDF
jgi:hypothetical protein